MKQLHLLLWHHRSSRMALFYLVFLFLVAVFRNQIATTEVGWLIPFGPNEISAGTASFKPPGFTEANGLVHYLGTDNIGRDVAARIVHGAGNVLSIGVISTLISFFIAVFLGVLAGYIGDRSLRFNMVQLGVVIIALFIGWFYAGQWSVEVLETGLSTHRPWIFAAVLVVFVSGGILLAMATKKVPLNKYYLPMDFLVIKFIEIFKAIPGLFFILALLSIIATPNISNVIVIIGILGWPMMTRMLRAEIMRLKAENFVKASLLTGIPHWRLIVNHILPGALAPLVVAFAFSVSASILIESTLSFLNIGLPQNQPSWGNILSAARQYFPAWWMAVVPGLLIFLTVLAFNAIGDRINTRDAD